MTHRDQLDRLNQLYAVKEEVESLKQDEDTRNLLVAIRLAIASFEDIPNVKMAELISELRNHLMAIRKTRESVSRAL